MEKMTMTVQEIQEALGVGRNVAYNLVNRADFPALRVGRKIIIPRAAFLRWLDTQTQQEAK